MFWAIDVEFAKEIGASKSKINCCDFSKDSMYSRINPDGVQSVLELVTLINLKSTKENSLALGLLVGRSASP